MPERTVKEPSVRTLTRPVGVLAVTLLLSPSALAQPLLGGGSPGGLEGPLFMANVKVVQEELKL